MYVVHTHTHIPLSRRQTVLPWLKPPFRSLPLHFRLSTFYIVGGETRHRGEGRYLFIIIQMLTGAHQQHQHQVRSFVRSYVRNGFVVRRRRRQKICMADPHPAAGNVFVRQRR